MYRNSRLLVACSDCHDMHGAAAPYRRFLLHNPDDSASPLCQGCHTVDILSHMERKLNARMKGEQTRCIDCHMPGTANTGGIAGDFGRMIKTPPYGNAQEEENNAYWQGSETKAMVRQRVRVRIVQRKAAHDREALCVRAAKAIGGCIGEVVPEPAAQRRHERGAVIRTITDLLEQEDIDPSFSRPDC
jgi:predicted CXXCH cytochrome family protein